MNYYTLTKKQVNQIEKDFAKTVAGRKARLPVLLSMILAIAWAVVSLGTIAMYFVSMCWSYLYGYYWNVEYIRSEPMSFFIAFLAVVLLCFISMMNYNRELKDFIKSLDGEQM